MTRESGYTLLELLVVLAIMAILLAAIPGIALPGVEAAEFSGKVEEVVSRLTGAHEMAIESGRTIFVTSADLADSGTIVTIPSTTSEVIFFPDGTVTGSTVVLRYLGRERKLTIDSVTGRVRT